MDKIEGTEDPLYMNLCNNIHSMKLRDKPKCTFRGTSNNSIFSIFSIQAIPWPLSHKALSWPKPRI
jgi:hypothetical protein